MSDRLLWSGVDVEGRSLDDDGRSLGGLNALFERFVGQVCQARELNLPSDVAHALEDLTAAYELTAPLFSTIPTIPRARRLANAGEYGELLSRLAVAEIACVTAIARARSEFLYRSLHDASPPE